MEGINVQQLINNLLKKEKERNYEVIKQDMLKELAEEKGVRDGFEDRLYLRWRKALDLFETILLLGREAGAEFNQRIRPYAAKQDDFVFEVLTRIHGRSCLTTSAILSLLKSGHASDALARARTLHELRVTATFIKEKGNNIAESYLLYEAVESLHAAKQYDKHYQKLGLRQLESGTIAKLEQRVQKYKTKFLSHLPEKAVKEVLRGDHGWASVALNNNRPTFADIEKHVNLEHWRPYFRMASTPVHGGVKGIKFDIGYMETENLLFAGPTNAGLADPASIALISFHATTTLLLVHMNYIAEKDLLETHLKALVAAQVLQELLDEANQEFLNISSLSVKN